MEKGKKKVNKNKVKYETTEQAEIKNFIIVIVVVLLCVGAIYLATRLFVTKDLFKKEEAPVEEVVPGKIDYSVATMGTMLNKEDKEYYIAIYDADPSSDYYYDMMVLISEYKALKEHLPIYVVDLSNHLNKSFYDPENVNVEAKTLEEIKVGDITLIKVKKGEIKKYIVDYAKMQKELGIEEE